MSKRGTEWKKKNDPPILALLRGLAGSRTANIVQIFISTPKMPTLLGSASGEKQYFLFFVFWVE